MEQTIPSAAEVRQRLVPLKRRHLVRLAKSTGVPLTTLQKIQSGETSDPRIETVRKVWAVIDLISDDALPAAA